MKNYEAYIEAHNRISLLIDRVDMDDFDLIAGTSMGFPSEDVLDAMYEIATNHADECVNLENEQDLLLDWKKEARDHHLNRPVEVDSDK